MLHKHYKVNLVLFILIFTGLISLIPQFKFKLTSDFTADEALSAVFAMGLHKKLDPYNEKKHDLQNSIDQKYSYNPFTRFLQISDALTKMGETHPPLFYFSLSYWIDLFGETKTSLRLHAFLGFGFFFILFIFLCYSMNGSSYALLCILLALTTAQMGLQFLNARMHIWTLSITTLIFYASLFLKKKPSWIYLTCLLYILTTLHSFLLWPIILISATYIALQKKIKLPLYFSVAFLVSYYFLFAAKQLNNLPIDEFMYGERNSINFLFQIFQDSDNGILAVVPFYSWLKTFNFLLPFYIIAIFFIAYQIFKRTQSRKYLFYITIIITPYMIDLIVGGHSSLWGNARSINYIMIPIILVCADLICFIYKKNKTIAVVSVILAFAMNLKLSLYFFRLEVLQQHQGQTEEMSSSVNKEHDIFAVTNSHHLASIFKLILALRSHSGSLTVLETTKGTQDWGPFILKEYINSPSEQLLIVHNLTSIDYNLELPTLEVKRSGILRIPTGKYDHFNWQLYGQQGGTLNIPNN